MIRLCSLTLCATLGFLGCGSNTSNGGSTKSAGDIVPGDNTVSGWTIDRSVNKNANGQPMTGSTKADVEGLIDGAASPFYIAPYTPKMFAWQNYVNSTLPAAPPPDGATILMYILQMPSAEQASGLYSAVLKLTEYNARTNEGWTATSPAVGTESRIQDTNSAWWINFYQGVFYVEISLTPSAGPGPDYTPGNADTKKEAVRFAQAVASRI